jgi:quinoprotein glucose dehydrogenase
MFDSRARSLVAAAAACILLPAPAWSWSWRGGAPGGGQYAALDQIDRGNVAKLELAWIYRTGHVEGLSEALRDITSVQDTPIIAAGSLIVCTPFGRLIALDPATGAERWSFDPKVDRNIEQAGRYTCRGVAQWTDPEAADDAACATRLLYGTIDRRAFAIDAATGRPCEDFGEDGVVAVEPDKPLLFSGEFQFRTVPAVIGDVAVFGSMVFDTIRNDSPRGTVRAFDARSGRLRWTFEPIPQDSGDPAFATWEEGSAHHTGNANVWAFMSVDEGRDLVFLPTTSPANDFYGGTRPGDNRYTDSVVALRGSTGELVWHFQIVHHDLWDYDLPAQPILIDLERDGASVPAVVQLTKQGLTFVLHRESGAPLFPVEERPVPPSDIEGERASPTQPFPLAPPPLAATSVTPEDAWGLTFIDRWMCRRRIERLRHGPLYTPPSLEGTVQPASSGGGANWGGGAWDPQRRLLVVPTMNIPGVLTLRERAPEETWRMPPFDVKQEMGGPQFGAPHKAGLTFLSSPLGVPCTAPPWGRLTAIDLDRGTIAWQVALGSIEKLLPIEIEWELGTPPAGGPLATAGGLVFIAATLDDKFRAFDIETGEKLWQTELPTGGHATPMSYLAGGRQFVLIEAGGHPMFGSQAGDYVLAFALPHGSHAAR